MTGQTNKIGSREGGKSPASSPRVSPRLDLNRLPPATAGAGRSGDSDMQVVHLSSMSPESLKSLMREALRAELLSFFGSNTVCASRGSTASDKVQGFKTAGHRTQIVEESKLREQPLTLDAEAKVDVEALHRELTHDHFSKFLKNSLDIMGLDHGHEGECLREEPESEGRPTGSMSSLTSFRQASVGTSKWIKHKITNIWHLEEPERTGMLARFTKSLWLERVVQFVILLNCIFMLVSANHEVRNPHTNPDALFNIGTIAFQAFYSCELVLKMSVHRWFFFWNADAGFNTFDCFLVVSGFADILLSSTSMGGSTVLRSARILKLGKALRALRVISQFNQLRAILVCIYGSFSMLCFSVLMLCIFFFMFSLIFVQQVADHFEELPDTYDPWSAEEESVIADMVVMFGSVQRCMLTLAMAIFGGEDWGVPYNALSEVGVIASILFLLFVAFANIALINIITGLFVDAAMMNLAPDSEQRSWEHQRREAEMATELENLCLAVDDDFTGKLTREQFRQGIKRGRIPMLLHLLGLDKEHMKAFFDLLCDNTSDQQVDIRSFVRGCMRLKGAATSFDLQLMHVDIMEFRKLQERDFHTLRERLGALERTVQDRSLMLARGPVPHSPCRTS